MNSFKEKELERERERERGREREKKGERERDRCLLYVVDASNLLCFLTFCESYVVGTVCLGRHVFYLLFLTPSCFSGTDNYICAIFQS